VTANQPNRRGKWKCTDYCDMENHHVHTWCRICERKIDHEERLNHNCRFGLGIRKIHPEMDPEYLYNDVFWTEPQLVRDQIPPPTDTRTKHEQQMDEIRNINQRHLNELNGEGTSRTPIIETSIKSLGKRFRPY
jgi:hypothetical protein